jgi:hypothetical protein
VTLAAICGAQPWGASSALANATRTSVSAMRLLELGTNDAAPRPARSFRCPLEPRRKLFCKTNCYCVTP